MGETHENAFFDGVFYKCLKTPLVMPENAMDQTMPQNAMGTKTPENALGKKTPENTMSIKTPKNAMNIKTPQNALIAKCLKTPEHKISENAMLHSLRYDSKRDIYNKCRCKCVNVLL